MGKLLAQQECVPAGCWHPISQPPKYSGLGSLVGKVTPLPPPRAFVHSPCGLTSELAGAVCSRKGIQDMQLKVDETLTPLAQCSPRFVWVCSLVTDLFVARRVPFVRLCVIPFVSSSV